MTDLEDKRFRYSDLHAWISRVFPREVQWVAISLSDWAVLCYGVGGTRGAAQRLARDFFPPPAGGNITLCI
jgi:hypothetical protein